MDPLIPDTSADVRLSGLERLLERYLGPRQPEFGAPDDEVRSVEMPAPLQRFYRFAGRWPGHNPQTPYANRFCMQDTLAGFVAREHTPVFELIDDRLVFVWENQGVWVAATDPSGVDPPVWISEDWDHQVRTWRQLDNPLS